MEVSQMNKTAILSFILDEVALKCRNVSTNMRKRIHWMLTLKEITVKEYDERVLVFNGWIRVGKYGTEIIKIEEMKKGVSNYCLQNKDQLAKLIALNKKVRCYRLEFDPTDPIQAESIEQMSVDANSYEIYSKCSFNKVKFLLLERLSTDQIKLILTKFKRIDKLEIYNSSLENIDFTALKTKEFHFNTVLFREPVYLPREISKLVLYYCKSPNLIKAQIVTHIRFRSYEYTSKQHNELAKTLKGVKVAEIDELLNEYFTSLPSTIRKIYIDRSWYEIDKIEETAKYLPYLVEIDRPITIEALDKAELKVINPIIYKAEEKLKLRPRKIIVNTSNARQLNNHPELFEKVEYVDINTKIFNFDLLSSEIKRIEIHFEVDEESVALNRFEKER